jgi:hypothetical protein
MYVWACVYVFVNIWKKLKTFKKLKIKTFKKSRKNKIKKIKKKSFLDSQHVISSLDFAR